MSIPRIKGRKLKPNESSHIVLNLNEKQVALINKLVEAGLYGNSANQVALRIVDERLAKEVPRAV